MANPLEVFWSFRAEGDLENIYHYLESKWSDKEVSEFKFKLEKAISLIASRPKLFRSTNHRKNLRRCVLSKQTIIYYFENENSVLIVSLFDNRQDPGKSP